LDSCTQEGSSDDGGENKTNKGGNGWGSRQTNNSMTSDATNNAWGSRQLDSCTQEGSSDDGGENKTNKGGNGWGSRQTNNSMTSDTINTWGSGGLEPCNGGNERQSYSSKKAVLGFDLDDLRTKSHAIPSRKPCLSKGEHKLLPRLENECCKVIVHRIVNHPACFLTWKWGHLLHIEERELLSSQVKDIPLHINREGKRFELLVVKTLKNNYEDRFERLVSRIYYIEVSEDGVQKMNLKIELLNIADFSSMKATKLVCRLELMVTPAIKLKNTPLHFDSLCSTDFESIEENNHEGCGFISRKLLEKICGDKVGTNIFALQVRIFSPQLGFIKGMLMLKDKVSNIEIPPSMIKVPPSTISNDNWVYFLVCGIFPSHHSTLMERNLNVNHYLGPPPQSSEKELGRKFNKNMLPDLLYMSGVPMEVIKSYAFESRSWKHAHDANCVGVSDPTNSLPEGTIFVTGLAIGGVDKEIFVTRFPCTDADDGKLLISLGIRPKCVSTDAWKFLISLPFGAIIFSSPSKGLPSLPSQIASGDLDGDLYFVCWDRELLRYMKESKESQKFDEDISESDECIGIEFKVTRDGKLLDAIVVGKEDNDKYSVEIGKQTKTIETFSKDDIFDGRFEIKKVLDHEQNGQNLKILVQNTAGDRHWMDVDQQLKKESPEALADYAIEKKLLKNVRWKWAEKYVRDAKVLRIIAHHKESNHVKVKVQWDDGDIEWINLEDIKDNAVDVLVNYASDKDLRNRQGWLWTNEIINRREKDWFKNAQKVMSNLKALYDTNKMITDFHHYYIKRLQHDEIKKELGNAFKQCTDLRKHGRKVKVSATCSPFIHPKYYPYIDWT